MDVNPATNTGLNATLKICYDPNKIPVGVNEASLVFYSQEGAGWVKLNTSIDTVNHCATVTTTHFSIWTLAPAAAPAVSGITRLDPNFTNAVSLNFRVAFTQAVINVSADDFELTTSGSFSVAPTVASITPDPVDESVYTVTVNTGSGAGAIRLDLKGGTDIQATDITPISGGYTGGEEYTFDNIVPTVVSIVRADANHTDATSVNFTVTFSEDLTVDTASFKLTNSLITGASITAVTPVSGSVYTVTVNTGTGNGAIRLDIPSTAVIADNGGNTVAVPYTSGETYTVYKGNAPTVPMLKTPLASALVTNTPTLDWGDSSEVMALANPGWHYEIYVTALDGFAFADSTADQPDSATGLAASQYTFTTPLASNTTFTWKVRACNDHNQCSAWSLTRAFRTKLATPVLNLPADNAPLNNKRPTFEWDEVPGATGYTIQVLKKSPTTGLFTVISNTFTLTGGAKYYYVPTVDLLPGTQYAWKVKANGLNAGDYSAPFFFTTSANPPKPPVQTAPLTGASILSSANPSLIWTAPLSSGLITTPATYFPLATGYDVQVSTNLGFENISPSNNVKTLNVGTTNTTLAAVLATGTAPDNVVRPGRTYYWRVRSISAAGNYSSWTTPARTILVKFIAPTLIAVVNSPVAGKPTFTWDMLDNGIWTNCTITVVNATTNAVVRTFIVPAPYKTYTIPAALLRLPAGNYKWKVTVNGLYTPVTSALSPTFNVAP